MLQVGSEEGRSERTLRVVEEGLLLSGRDGVQAAEGQTEQSVVVGVRCELGRDRLGGLDSLAGDGKATDSDLVLVDVTAGRAAVTIGDLPGGTAQLRGSAALAGGVDGLAVPLAAGGLAAEDPEVGAAGVEVQVEDLGRGTNRYRSEVLRVVLSGSGGRTAGGTLDSTGGVGDGGLELFGQRNLELSVRLGQGKRTILDVLGVADLGGGERTLLRSRGADARRDGRCRTRGGEQCGKRDVLEGDHLD